MKKYLPLISDVHPLLLRNSHIYQFIVYPSRDILHAYVCMYLFISHLLKTHMEAYLNSSTPCFLKN